MTEEMQKAQCREIKKIGATFTREEQAAVLESIETELLFAELYDRLTKAEITISQMKDLMTKK